MRIHHSPTVITTTLLSTFATEYVGNPRMLRRLLVVLVLLASSAVRADCADVPPAEATCTPISLYFETDPSGIGNYVRFTGEIDVADEIIHPTLADNALHGPVRWSIDGVAFAESGVTPSSGPGSRSFKTFLIAEDFDAMLARVGIVLTADSLVFAEYVGDESYSGLDSRCGQQGQAVCKIAIQSSARFGDLQPRKVQYPSWDATITTDRDTVGFAESVTITTSWELPGEFEQLGIDGRFYLFESDNLLATVPVELGTRQRYSAVNSTLAPGEYQFGAMYVGTEGIVNIVNSDTLVVKPPRRAIRLAVIPANSVTRAGAIGGPQVCVRGADDTMPDQLPGSEVFVAIHALSSNGASDIPSTTETVSLGADGCAALMTAALTPGRYSIKANMDESDVLLGTTAGGPLTIVNDDPETAVVLDSSQPVGAKPVDLTLVAPDVPAIEGGVAADESYVRIRPGLVFQAETLDSAALDRPVRAIQLFINGQFTSAQFLDAGGAAHVTFPALDLADGNYAAVLAYGGDDTHAISIGDVVQFEVTAAGIAVPAAQTGLTQPTPDVAAGLDIELSLDVNRIIDGEPLVLTGQLQPRDVIYPKGVPAGTLVFHDDDIEIGRVALTSYSGAILLPAGLPPGPHQLHVEFRQ